MNNPFYQLKHANCGELRFELDSLGKFVQFACYWPFDLSTNETIHLSNKFPLKGYARKVRSLAKLKCASIRGTDGGSIQLKVVGKKSLEVSVIGSGKALHEEFCFELPARLEELLPNQGIREKRL